MQHLSEQQLQDLEHIYPVYSNRDTSERDFSQEHPRLPEYLQEIGIEHEMQGILKHYLHQRWLSLVNPQHGIARMQLLGTRSNILGHPYPDIKVALGLMQENLHEIQKAESEHREADPRLDMLNQLDLLANERPDLLDDLREMLCASHPVIQRALMELTALVNIGDPRGHLNGALTLLILLEELRSGQEMSGEDERVRLRTHDILLLNYWNREQGDVLRQELQEALSNCNPLITGLDIMLQYSEERAVACLRTAREHTNDSRILEGLQQARSIYECLTGRADALVRAQVLGWIASITTQAGARG